MIDDEHNLICALRYEETLKFEICAGRGRDKKRLGSGTSGGGPPPGQDAVARLILSASAANYKHASHFRQNIGSASCSLRSMTATTRLGNAADELFPCQLLTPRRRRRPTRRPRRDVAIFTLPRQTSTADIHAYHRQGIKFTSALPNVCLDPEHFCNCIQGRAEKNFEITSHHCFIIYIIILITIK